LFVFVIRRTSRHARPERLRDQVSDHTALSPGCRKDYEWGRNEQDYSNSNVNCVNNKQIRENNSFLQNNPTTKNCDITVAANELLIRFIRAIRVRCLALEGLIRTSEVATAGWNMKTWSPAQVELLL
jgi:hypothetical protein